MPWQIPDSRDEGWGGQAKERISLGPQITLLCLGPLGQEMHKQLFFPLLIIIYLIKLI